MASVAMTLDEVFVTPEEVRHGTTVFCPETYAPMYRRNSRDRGPEFIYYETPAHAEGRNLLYGQLQELYGEYISNIETDIPRVKTPKPINRKIPDVRADFAEPLRHLGNGIAGEVVETNTINDEKTEEYLQEGFTVIWIQMTDSGKFETLEKHLPGPRGML